MIYKILILLLTVSIINIEDASAIKYYSNQAQGRLNLIEDNSNTNNPPVWQSITELNRTRTADNVNVTFFDIASYPEGNSLLFGSTASGDLYKFIAGTNPSDGIIKAVPVIGSLTGGRSLGFDPTLQTVGSAQGYYLYGMGGSQISRAFVEQGFTYSNNDTLTWTNVVNTGIGTAGDLAVVGATLYYTALNNDLVRVDLTDFSFETVGTIATGNNVGLIYDDELSALTGSVMLRIGQWDIPYIKTIEVPATPGPIPVSSSYCFDGSASCTGPSIYGLSPFTGASTPVPEPSFYLVLTGMIGSIIFLQSRKRLFKKNL